MYKIKGIKEVIYRNLPMALSNKEQAKIKLIRGDVGRNISFRDNVHQFKAELVYSRFYDYSRFEYVIPFFSVSAIIYKINNPNDNTLDIDYIVSSSHMTSYKFDTFQMEWLINKGYTDFLILLSDAIGYLVEKGVLLYKESDLSIYYSNLSNRVDVILGLRDKEVVFVFGINIRIADPDKYKGVDFKSSDNFYILTFKFQGEYEYICYISRSDYRVVRDEVKKLCTV